MDLSKKDKKAARIIIDKGLEKEFARVLEGAGAVIEEWQAGGLPDREAYHKLFQHVRDRDKEIARWYDGLRGSDYIYTVLHQYREGFITDEDIATFSEEGQTIVSRYVSLWAEEEEDEPAE